MHSTPKPVTLTFFLCWLAPNDITYFKEYPNWLPEYFTG